MGKIIGAKLKVQSAKSAKAKKLLWPLEKFALCQPHVIIAPEILFYVI
jgi:hypothetical protein